MSTKMFTFVVAACLVFILSGCGRGSESNTAATPAKGDSSGRCAHDIKAEKCPFCNPQLVESEGFCGAHGVAEGLCYQCRPYLKAAFRSKGDWCAEHNAPESQCVICNPELKEKVRPGEHGTQTTSAGSGTAPTPGNCEHGIAQAQCPFCTPSLIQSMGFCSGHSVPEALCVRCNSYLEVAYKANGDWCAEHNTPESQCVICNPELKNQSSTPGTPGGGQG